MSVFTPLNQTVLGQLVSEFGFEYISSEPVHGGMENTIYRINVLDGCEIRPVALILFEQLSRAAAQCIPQLVASLHAQAIPVAPPYIHLPSGKYDVDVGGKICMLTEWKNGCHPQQATLAQCQQIGQALGQLHTCALQQDHILRDNFTQMFPDDLVLSWPADRLEMSKQQRASYQQLCRIMFRPDIKTAMRCLPCGLIHADLFRDNALFIDDQLQAILDFSAAVRGVFVYDVAVVVNDFCFESATGQLCIKHFEAVLAGYEQQRRLTVDEKHLFALMMACAAGYFALGRLYAQKAAAIHHYHLDLVCVKDPADMFAILQQQLVHLDQL